MQPVHSHCPNNMYHSSPEIAPHHGAEMIEVDFTEDIQMSGSNYQPWETKPEPVDRKRTGALPENMTVPKKARLDNNVHNTSLLP